MENSFAPLCQVDGRRDESDMVCRGLFHLSNTARDSVLSLYHGHLCNGHDSVSDQNGRCSGEYSFFLLFYCAEMRKRFDRSFEIEICYACGSSESSGNRHRDRSFRRATTG
jgi:hypothetical protein